MLDLQMLPVGTMLDGRYKIERYIASGGFGNTYVAFDTRFNSRVAIKEFFIHGTNHRDGDSSAVVVSNVANVDGFNQQLDKFRREAKRIFDMRNDHIVHVIDLFDANGTSYYVMDFIEGESLSARVKRGPLTEAEVRDVAAQLLDALGAIHKAGFFHLDVKPGNIMIDKEGHCTLIDFGASKQMSAMELTTLSASGMVFTPGYAPVEQETQRTKSIGPWTDFYAVGATLYNLLTGQRPPEVDPDDTTEGSRMFAYPAVVSLQMRQAISRMMNPSIRKRPQNVEQMRVLLEGYPGAVSAREDTVTANPPVPNAAPMPHFQPQAKPSRHYQTDEKPNDVSSGLKGVWIAVCILSAIILALGGWMLYDYVFKNTAKETASQTVAAAMDCLVNNDFRGYAQYAYIEENTNEEAKKTAINLAANTAEKLYKENPVTKYEILSEEAQGDDKAAVEVRITQKDGRESTSKFNMVKNKVGKWRAKDSNDNKSGDAAVQSKSTKDTSAAEKAKRDVEESVRTSDISDRTFTVNGVSFTMKAVNGGSFTMGATSEQGGEAENDERPAHTVTLSDYMIGATEVTQGLWLSVMDYNPSQSLGNDLPVEDVTWEECQTFIRKLNEATEGNRPSGRVFRMPTEAEWEFAARGGRYGIETKYAGGTLSSVAWYESNSSKTHPVGRQSPNELGLYDMSGNVWEWCQDWYESGYYRTSPGINPCNYSRSEFHVYRGGSWRGGSSQCRVSNRGYPAPSCTLGNLGLRLAM